MKKYLFTLILILFLCSLTYAGGFDSLVNEAKKSQSAGDALKSVVKLKEAILSIWNEVPLTVRNVRLVTDTENYTPKDSNIYAPGEHIYIILELLGYKIKKIGNLYNVNIATDLYVLDEEDNIIAGKQGFIKFNIKTYIPNTEFKLDLDYMLTDATKGIYNLQTVIHDLNSNKKTKFTKKIEIR